MLKSLGKIVLLHQKILKTETFLLKDLSVLNWIYGQHGFLTHKQRIALENHWEARPHEPRFCDLLAQDLMTLYEEDYDVRDGYIETPGLFCIVRNGVRYDRQIPTNKPLFVIYAGRAEREAMEQGFLSSETKDPVIEAMRKVSSQNQIFYQSYRMCLEKWTEGKKFVITRQPLQ